MSTTSTIKVNAPDHTIKSVTIFKSSKAEIVRHFSLHIKAGQTKVEIRGLPGSIDTHSVRVSGLGEARLYDVVCTIGVSKDASYAADSPSEIIRLLQVKKHALENEKRLRNHEADLLLSYAKTLSGEHVAPSQMSAFLESFVQQGHKNLNDITDVDEKTIAIDRQIESETEKRASKKGDARGEVDIILGADYACTVADLKLTYIVSDVSWAPKYELHAKTENGKPSSSVALHYRARVVQSTGEDWTNTLLTLSTMSSDTIAKRIPQLVPVKLRPRDTQQATNQQQGSLFGSAAEDEFEAIPAPETITGPTTFVNETPVAISFSISGESTIPSDGIDHQVSVAVLPFEVKISYVTIPRIEPRVYLQCEVKNSSEYRLLAGPVNVILDDSYVSKTSINDVSTGDNFDCTLGDDAATKVTYSRTSRTVRSDAGSFSEAQSTTTYNTKITIYNKHGFALPDLVVREVVPTVDDKRAKVILRKPEGLADAKDKEVAVKVGEDVVKVGWEKLGGEKEGKFSWRGNVRAKDKVVLESEWELKAPADTYWQEGMAN
ncbi:hypothetical protein C0991_011155 [Blastosporella zonata]|nr:hypothetical protein C0991_011155 [Blastosporella zonata]